MYKVLKITAATLLAAFVAYTFFFLWKQSQPKPDVYEIVIPQKRDIVKKTIATGSLEARNKVELKPLITGVIKELHVKPGQYVTAGQTVAVIDVIPDMSRVDQANSAIESARIVLNGIKREALRSQSLYDKGVISKEENERKQNELASAQESLSSAISQAQVISKGASTRSGGVSTNIVKASASGIVLSVPAKVGASVSGSSSFSEGTTIATIANMNDIIFRGNIDETQVAHLHIGMDIDLTLGAVKDIVIPATLEYISPECSVINGAKMFEIKASARIPKDIEVRSGYSVNANIILAQQKGVISIDETCIEYEADKPYVYVLTSGDSDVQTYERIPVTLGISDGLYVEVKEGITKDMKIRGIKKE